MFLEINNIVCKKSVAINFKTVKRFFVVVVDADDAIVVVVDAAAIVVVVVFMGMNYF